MLRVARTRTVKTQSFPLQIEPSDQELRQRASELVQEIRETTAKTRRIVASSRHEAAAADARRKDSPFAL